MKSYPEYKELNVLQMGLNLRNSFFSVCEQAVTEQVRRLISAFVICLLESIISTPATSEI